MRADRLQVKKVSSHGRLIPRRLDDHQFAGMGAAISLRRREGAGRVRVLGYHIGRYGLAARHDSPLLIGFDELKNENRRPPTPPEHSMLWKPSMRATFSNALRNSSASGALPLRRAAMNAAKISRVAFLGDYLPRQCGIATFTTDICESMAAEYPDCECIVGAVNDRPEGYDYSPRIRFEIEVKELDSYRRAADFLNINNIEVVSVQHEFGIYGGPAGSHLLALLRDVQMPVVTTLHTVLRDPNSAQKYVMEQLDILSSRFIVMAERGRTLLQEVYGVASDKIDLIPHGVPDVQFIDPTFHKDQFGVEGKRCCSLLACSRLTKASSM